MEMRRWRRGGDSGEVGGSVGVVTIFGAMVTVRMVRRDVGYLKNETVGIDGDMIVFLFYVFIS